MKRTIYKKDHNENIKMFNDLGHPGEYSNYSIDLNRHFGDRSYAIFYKKLIEDKKYATDNFRKLFEKDNKIKGLKVFEESFNIDEFKKSLKTMKKKQLLYNKKLKNPYLERLLHSKNHISLEYKKKPKIIKPYCPEVPEVGRYTPSYKAINKHIYEVDFSKTGTNNSTFFKTNDNVKKKSKTIYHHVLKKIPNKSIYFSKDDITLDKNNFNTQKYYTPMPTTPKKRFLSLNNTHMSSKKIKLKDIINKSKDNKELEDIFHKTHRTLSKLKNNHCLKFEDYTARKPLLKEIPYNTENDFELPNYYTQKYIRGNIDFNKISSNKKIKSYFEELSNKFKNPPIGFYQPKYDSVLNKTRDIYFYKKQLPSSRQKKIKQIIYSYNVHYNYEIAPSLNDRTKNNIEEFYNLKTDE